MLRLLLLALSLGLLAGCSEERKESDVTVFDTQLDAVRKARETQETMQKGAERTRQAIEEAETRVE